MKTYAIRFHVEAGKVVEFTVDAPSTAWAISEAWEYTDGPMGYSATMETMQRAIGITRPCRFMQGCHIQVNRRWFKLTAEDDWVPSSRSQMEMEYRGTDWMSRWQYEMSKKWGMTPPWKTPATV